MSRCGGVCGQEVRGSTQSGAVLSSGAESGTFGSSRVSLLGARRERMSDRTFTFSSGVLTPAYDTHRVVYSTAAAGFNHRGLILHSINKESLLSATFAFASLSPLRLSRPFIKCCYVSRGSVSSCSALLCPVCQLLPLTQPLGASSSADVLHKEAHRN